MSCKRTLSIGNEKHVPKAIFDQGLNKKLGFPFVIPYVFSNWIILWRQEANNKNTENMSI